MKSVADLRREYSQKQLDEQAAGGDPVALFERWLAEAIDAQALEPNAMVLATVDAAGQPRARVVLLKGLEGGAFSFYTNYDSAKGQELSAHARAALVFHWPELERQVRVEGTVERLSEAASDAYWKIRPRGSQLGGWASPQSKPMQDRAALEASLVAVTQRFGSGEVPRPANWGGFALTPARLELWQGRPNRMHDRLVYTRESAGAWSRQRLAP